LDYSSFLVALLPKYQKGLDPRWIGNIWTSLLHWCWLHLYGRCVFVRLILSILTHG
jgi:hypothetical protein